MEAKKMGNKIAEARKSRNISQAQLAEQLFISAQAVGKWERGESIPDFITMNRLAEILGVDLNFFSEKFSSIVTESTERQTKTETENKPEEKTKQKGWDMSRGNWTDADFSGLKNLHSKFSAANMQRCKFTGSDLSGLLLKNNNVANCDFSECNISNSLIQASNLLANRFAGSRLHETEFAETKLEKCDFTNAGLNVAKFTKSFIYGCNLSGTDCTGMTIRSGGISGIKSAGAEKNTIENAIWNNTSFIDSQIADLVFTGTLNNCCFENCAFTRVTFKDATLANTFFKNNRNLKRVKFTDCHADRITYEFLKSGGSDLNGILLISE
jgi:uncharacterized protein YjbI with pentapeptide repeats